MRKRLLPLGAAMAVALGLLTAAPAAASYAVESITFPDLGSEFYSPFSGPASIKFTFDGTENDATFNVRLRPAGETAIFTKDVFVDADDPAGFQIKSVKWPALSVNSARQYVVAVYRNKTQIKSESFFLRPPLVSITGATPNPFLPWIDDDIKDETHISYKLVADSNPTIVKVYAANSQGKCCGAKVFEQPDGSHPAGANQYTWNGRTAEVGGTLLPKGDYFVRITAEDAANVVKTSKPFKVTIARTYRKLAKLQKSATAYHHVGPVTAYLRGGNCFVTDAQTDLWITCLHAKFTIYWRWNLPNGGRIENVSWTFVPISGDICRFTKGHTTADSWMRAGATSGQVRCRLDLAKITYSVPTPS